MSKKIKLKDFSPDDKNFNKHTKYGMELLERSVDKIGVIESITVSSDDKVISGNARQEVMNSKFEGIDPIIVETDGKRPIILKRTDIKSNSKQFHEAALLANTVSKHNVNLDRDKIEEVAVEEYGIDIEELGIEVIEMDDYGDEEKEKGQSEPTTMIAVVLTDEEAEEWLSIKENLKIKGDKNAIFKLITHYQNENDIS